MSVFPAMVRCIFATETMSTTTTQLRALSITYRKADVALRELVALSDEGARNAMVRLKDVVDPADLLILSTCNRTEVYYTSDQPQSRAILQAIAFQNNITDLELLLASAEEINDQREAVRRLFQVALGLDSQVVGDLQIINQVKQAYQRTADLQMAGPFLHRLLHTIFFASKRVVQETSFRDGAASTSYAAVELAEELTQSLIQPRVLIVGLGEIGVDVVRNLADKKRFSDIRVCNRTDSKAEELALEIGLMPVPFANLWAEVQSADVIISSVSGSFPLFGHDDLAKLEVISHKFFIDLSMPRSVASTAEQVPGILVYNIDQLQQRTDATLEARLAAVPQVEEIIDQALGDFDDWSREMIVSPTINRLKQALEQIRQEELARHVKQVSDHDAELIEKVTKSMMQKVIKLHVVPLKAACKRGDADELIGVLNDLFNLEHQEA
jgi:glutamyl-tRNA reductase